MTTSSAALEDWRACVAASSLVRRPFVTASFALSADDCLARHRDGGPAISSLDATIVAHRLRSANDAVLVGIGTVLADDPTLATRLVKGPTGQRVVLDAKLRLPHAARVLHARERRVRVFGGLGADASRVLGLRAAGAHVDLVNEAGRGLELHAVLERLRQRNVGTVLVAGGARVLESFFAAGLVDYVSLTRAPVEVQAPEAVHAGPRTRAALQVWKQTIGFHAGVDHVGFGRWG